MDADNVEKKVKDILAGKLEVAVDNIQNTSLLVKDLGIDSFGGIQLLFDLKEEFNIEIPIETLQKIETVADVVQCVLDTVKE